MEIDIKKYILLRVIWKKGQCLRQNGEDCMIRI